MSFPANFIWGTATSSYQIEGAHDADGKGPSIWDDFVRRPGKVANGHTGDVACDHYRRYPEDVRLLKELGVQAYRLSVSWPRVLPEGTGRTNEAGLDFYDRLIDALLAAGVQPWVTLYHWDLPLALYHRGGWLNREIADWFGDYAALLARRLGDRVRHWMTLNEQSVFLGLGLLEGQPHAPGDRLSYASYLRAVHHSNLAHGRAVQALRAGGKPSRIGTAAATGSAIPATDDPRDIEAARTAFLSVRKRDSWQNPWYLDPVVLGRYPEEGLRLCAGELPDFRDGDLAIIAQPLDFLGYNCYTGNRWRAGADGRPEQLPRPPGHPQASLAWLNVEPDALYWASKFLHERYKLPIVITENGFDSLDWVALDGKVHDPLRIDYLHRYLRGLARGVKEGVPVEAYFEWSFLDNFEWAEGYKDRFGLVHVDFTTLERTPKDSYYWYRDVIRSNGAQL